MTKFALGNTVGRQWQKGVSANPKGRTPIIGEIRELARKQSKTAIRALVRIVKDEKSPPAAVVAAANSLLDRAFGKPEQSHQIAGDGMILQIITGIQRAPDEPLVLEAEAAEESEVRH